MPNSSIFLRCVVLRNYMSIAQCSTQLRSLNFLVGQNGSGKSNFLDALRFMVDSLNKSVEHALRDRGGIAEVRRRSTGHPTHFGIGIEFELPDGSSGHYAFRIGSKPSEGFEIQREECKINPVFGEGSSYTICSGEIEHCSLTSPPAASADRLFLVAASGQPQFRPLYDALTRMGFYNFNPEVIREMQSPDQGEILDSDGRNLASVLKRLAEHHKDELQRIIELLGKVVPGITDVAHKPLGKKETIEFRQRIAGSTESWRFDAENMSDGTLRVLGILAALFQTPSSDGRAVRLVGIEEPETALHPGAASVLRSALLAASRQTQILVTSHSPDLLDDKEISEDSIISVSNTEGKTMIGPADQASRDSIRDRLFTAGELLRLNQIATDEKALTSEQAGLFDK
jgi:predicted ATPase